MQYIKIDNKTYIEYDPLTRRSVTIDLDNIDEQLSKIAIRLEELESIDLHQWAIENYPKSKEYNEKIQLEQSRDKLLAKKESITNGS